ncbi:hypothetical protein QUI_2740 [Clostridioides difficile P59]|nr:hypothetical protein QUI_2740 [Clostridioides difficile P59]
MLVDSGKILIHPKTHACDKHHPQCNHGFLMCAYLDSTHLFFFDIFSRFLILFKHIFQVLSIVLLVLHRLSAVASNYYLGLHILSIVIGNFLILSPSFPPLHTVHDSFLSHGVPSMVVVLI